MPRPVLLVLLCLVLACHAAPATPEPAPEDRSILLVEAMRGSAAAWNRGDIAGHVALYTDSAQMMMKAGPRDGGSSTTTRAEAGAPDASPSGAPSWD